MPLLPDGTQVKVNTPLTNVSIAYMQENPFIADRVFPIVNVQRQGDLYWKYNRGDWYKTIAEQRAPATESAGGGWNLSTDSYYAKVFAVHKDLDDQTVANADSMFNLEADAARWTMQQLLLKREIDFLSAYFTGSVWSATAAAGGTWDTGTGAASPINVVRAKADDMEAATSLRPNTLIVGTKTHEGLLQNPDIIDRIKYTQQGIITPALLASVLDVDRYFVARAVGSAAGGETLSRLATTDSALLCYAAPRPGLQTPSAGYTFAWTGLLGAGALGVRTKRFRMEQIESTRIETEMAYDMKVTASDLGFFWTTTV